MAKRKRRRKKPSRAKKAIQKLRSNPGMLSTAFGVAKVVAPAAGTFFASAFISGRVEAVISGAGLTAPVPTTSTTKQRVAALGASVAFLLGTYAASKHRRLRDYQVSLLVGAGIGVLLQVVRLLWRPKQLQRPVAYRDTPAATGSNFFDAGFAPDPAAIVSVERDEDIDADLPGGDGNMFAGMFEQGDNF